MIVNPLPLRSGDFRKNRKAKTAGIALVIVLGAVVMVTILIMAFFSRAILNQRISASSTNIVKSDQIARSALDVVVGEFREEIKANSAAATNSGVTTYTPTNAAKMIPARDSATEAGVIRASSSSPLTGSAATALASSVPSSAPSQNSRAVSLGAWDKIRLRATALTAADAPKWILLTRAGPNTNASLTVAQAADKNDPNFVIGRYAYVVYDEGGLLNINVAGAPGGVDATEKGKKASVVFSDLTALGLTAAQADALVAWRNAAPAASYPAAILGSGGPVDSGFTKIAATDKTFLTRQSLLKYAKEKGLDLAPATTPLKYLATSTHERNSPSFAPASPTALNPDFNTLISPLTKKPLQRFALSRFRLLEQDPSALATPQDAVNILKHFGLTPAAGASNTHRAWTYRASTIGTPAAAIAAGRDPDLFELVKAAVVDGSLGVLNAESTNTGSMQIRDQGGGATYPPETNVHHQVARIIANMIDQYDADSYPTTITLGNNVTADPSVYGIESLPYFSRVMFKAHYPSGTFTNAAGASLRFYFELWNPHQNVGGGSTPANVRIVVNPNAQYFCNLIRYTLNLPPPANVPNLQQSIWGGAPNTPMRTFPAAYLPSGGGIDIGAIAGYLNPTRAGEMPLETPGAAPASFDPPPPSPGGNFVNLLTNNVVFSLQFKDASNAWHTYSSFAGMDNDGGGTGIQNTSQFTYNPFTNPDTPAVNQYSLVLFKPDPRTFRYRTGTSSVFRSGGTSDQNEQGLLEKVPMHFTSDASSAPLNGWPTGSLPIMVYKNDGLNAGTALVKAARDFDGVARKGDGYLGAGATTNPISQVAARPIVLNRPFRSVGELGYVFRDSPWKSVNFFSADSGDSGLLDLFSLEEAEVVAGKTNLNGLFSGGAASTQARTILKAMVAGAFRKEGDTASAISSTDRDQLVSDFAAAAGPLQNMGDVLTRFTTYTSNTVNSGNLSRFKTEREMAVRALSSGTQVRTWNLLIDLVAQVGRYPQNATAWEKFVVEGERHYWLHVSIDRFTGEVLKTQLETIND